MVSIDRGLGSRSSCSYSLLLFGWTPILFGRHALRQVSGLVYVAASADDYVAEEGKHPQRTILGKQRARKAFDEPNDYSAATWLPTERDSRGARLQLGNIRVSAQVKTFIVRGGRVSQRHRCIPPISRRQNSQK